ncbi:MAG TPA: transglutaminase domain-containing protein [Methanospirillum sp.]|nr:transglutaminase domain-containing protein [Methanospirillum sp.]HOL41337.1 transglutaminase domain-containing protein [Methanospirillum sp.]
MDPRVITLWLSAGCFEFLHRQQADDQMIEGSAGAHIRAEFYLEGYGWIPVDVPAAE